MWIRITSCRGSVFWRGDGAARQLCSRLLHKFADRRGFCEGSHVFEILWRKSGHCREGAAQVGAEPVDDARAPAFLPLPGDDVAADLPVEQDQLGVDGEGRLQSSRGDPLLQDGEEGGVACWKHGLSGRHRRSLERASSPARSSLALSMGLISRTLARLAFSATIIESSQNSAGAAFNGFLNPRQNPAITGGHRSHRFFGATRLS